MRHVVVEYDIMPADLILQCDTPDDVQEWVLAIENLINNQAVSICVYRNREMIFIVVVYIHTRHIYL
jgi:hypothetical protein